MVGIGEVGSHVSALLVAVLDMPWTCYPRKKHYPLFTLYFTAQEQTRQQQKTHCRCLL